MTEPRAVYHIRPFTCLDSISRLTEDRPKRIRRRYWSLHLSNSVNTGTQQRSILILDDHPLVREGLKAVLHTQPKYAVIGEAENGAGALQMVRDLKPDIALVDISLPDQSGIEVTRRIRDSREKTQVIIISMHSETDFIVKAFQAGARGYVVKEYASEKLIQAIQSVLNNELYLDSLLSGRVLERLIHLLTEVPSIRNGNNDALTGREQQLLALMAEGLTSDQIAGMLLMSPKTVKNHRSSIIKKLNIHSTHELIRCAAKLGLIDLDAWRQ